MAQPGLDVDGDGKVYVAWGGRDGTEFNSSGPVCYATRDPVGGTWTRTDTGRQAQGDRFVLEVVSDTVYLMRGVRSRLENGEGKGDEGYDQESLYLERYQDGGWGSLLATNYPTQDDDGQWYTLISVLDGDMAINADGDAYLAWIDNNKAWRQASTSLRLRTTSVASTTTAPQVTKHYYANGQRIATRVEGDLYYVLGDHLGSTSLVTDDQGNEVGHVIYDAYGAIVTNTLPATLTDRLFTGQVFDASTGLYYYNARYYDPFAGQFTQPDSLVADPLDPAAWNRFSYVYNSPTNYVDPSGHCPLCFVAIGASLFAMGSAIHYTATHPGASFDRAEYLSTVWHWTKWGGVGGAAFAAIGPGLGLFALEESAMFGATASQLFNAGLTTGAASVIVTGLAQGGYRDPTEVEDAFLSGFYTAYGLSLATGGIASAFNVSSSARLGRAIITGGVGASYGAFIKHETTWEEVATNFAASFIFGWFSPSVNATGERLAYKILNVPWPLPSLYVPGSGPYLKEYVAQGMGYAVSSAAVTAIKPSQLKFYWQRMQEGWQWFITH